MFRRLLQTVACALLEHRNFPRLNFFEHAPDHIRRPRDAAEATAVPKGDHVQQVHAGERRACVRPPELPHRLLKLPDRIEFGASNKTPGSNVSHLPGQ